MRRILANGALRVFLVMCISGCVPAPLVLKPSKCNHPIIDPSTNAGLADAVASYWGAVEECNKLNGFD